MGEGLINVICYVQGDNELVTSKFLQQILNKFILQYSTGFLEKFPFNWSRNLTKDSIKSDFFQKPCMFELTLLLIHFVVAVCPRKNDTWLLKIL